MMVAMWRKPADIEKDDLRLAAAAERNAWILYVDTIIVQTFKLKFKAGKPTDVSSAR